jgi:hypothetical protein
MSTRNTKRQGTIELPRNVIHRKVEKIEIEASIDNKTHKKVMIITIYETGNTIKIYIGNRDIYCMNVQLLKDAEMGTTDTGVLTKVRWDTVCSIDEPFGKGTDTIIMIKALVSYIHDNYPKVVYLTCNDMSTKTCDDGNSVSLAAMKLVTDGKTWYETHFDVMTDDINTYVYDKMKASITQKKQEMSFFKFSMYSQTQSLPIPTDIVQQLYDNSTTWQEFFSGVRDRIGISKLCIWLSRNNWFEIFLQTILRLSIPTVIFLMNVKRYDGITYKTIKNGGGKYKRTKKIRH